MTLSVLKNGDALFTVILRDPEAKTLLQQWTATSRSIQARVEENRMHIYDHNTLSLFLVTWPHKWDNINIWDPWIKRHINI
jgi:nicotinamide mononucleotide adenylyltransferase